MPKNWVLRLKNSELVFRQELGAKKLVKLFIQSIVKLYGEDDAGMGKIPSSKFQVPNKDIGRAFYARPLWQRISVVIAGVIMNFILAVTLISFLFATQGVALPSENVVVSKISKNSPAALVDIRPDDRVIKINGKKINSSEAFIAEANKNRGREVSLNILREGVDIEKKLTPRIKVPKGEGAIGVSITDIEIKKYNWLEAPIYGTIEAGKFSFMILQGLFNMVSDFVTTGSKPEGVAGPIGVAQLTGQAVSFGLYAVLWFMAILSLNLAVLNILPIPALDGGRFFFQIIELITRKKVSPRHEALAHGIGLVVLLGLMLVITFFDISRLVQGKSILP